MRPWIIIGAFLLSGTQLDAQYVYTIKADSVKITNCDSAELILENHTQNIPGFLFNTGNGRTVFKRGAVRINDSMYVVGGDTITIPQPNPNFWSLNGNANTNPATQYIGTSDAEPLIFGVGGTERMRIFTSTNVGIGTFGNDNGYKLQINAATGGLYAAGTEHVIGNLGITSGVDVGVTGQLGIRTDNLTGAPLWFEGSNGSPVMFGFQTAYGNITESIINQNYDMFLTLSGFKDANVANLNGTILHLHPSFDFDSLSWPVTLRGIYYDPVIGNLRGSRNISIETVSGDALFGTTSGNVGIGTNVPAAQLHTTGSVRFAGLTQDSTQTNVLVSDANGNLYTRSASSLALDNPIRSALAVNGTIKSKRIIISPDEWADYVLDSSYRLPRLAEVESYIRREHHLPGIPSAATIQKDSLDVGAGQAALLKKIEELTLYTIDQNKKIQSLQDEVEMMKKMILEDRKEKPRYKK